MVLKIKLSGGPDRVRQYNSDFSTKAEAQRVLRKLSPGIKFVSHGKDAADYIITPNGVLPSESALKTGGQHMYFSNFVRMLKTRNTKASKKKSSGTKKKTTRKANTTKKKSSRANKSTKKASRDRK